MANIPPELTPPQVVAWLRHQAAKYAKLADDFAREFGIAEPSEPPNKRPPLVPVFEHGITAARVKRAMAGRKMRQKDIATELEISPESLDAILTEANGFVRGERGWILAKEGGEQ